MMNTTAAVGVGISAKNIPEQEKNKKRRIEYVEL